MKLGHDTYTSLELVMKKNIYYCLSWEGLPMEVQSLIGRDLWNAVDHRVNHPVRILDGVREFCGVLVVFYL